MTAIAMPAAETVGTDSRTELEALVAVARSGDRAAMEEFLRQIDRRVYIFAFRMVGNAAGAEDVAQEALWKICRSLKQYRSGTNLWGWIYRIVLNQAHDWRRSERRSRWVEAVDTPAEEQDWDQREQLRRLIDALSLLTEKERAALVLLDMEGLSSAEAAQVMGCLRITARSRATQARKKVRKFLSRYYPELRED